MRLSQYIRMCQRVLRAEGDIEIFSSNGLGEPMIITGVPRHGHSGLPPRFTGSEKVYQNLAPAPTPQRVNGHRSGGMEGPDVARREAYLRERAEG